MALLPSKPGWYPNPLDRSSVHPEAYAVVQKIIQALDRDIRHVIGDTAALRKLVPAKFADERFGVPTVSDILKELEKPGRDPRPEFKTATFQEGVTEISDLKPGMVLEGVVTNVANFGAFVDIGVHQDGLVHISALAEKFVKDPREVVKAGQIVKVKVLEVDPKRQRVALTMRMSDTPGASSRQEGSRAGGGRPEQRGSPPQRDLRMGNGPRGPSAPPPGGAMAAAFAKLKGAK